MHLYTYKKECVMRVNDSLPGSEKAFVHDYSKYIKGLVVTIIFHSLILAV